MKKQLFIFLSTLLLPILYSFYPVLSEVNDQVKEIRIEKEKGGTRSATTTVVSAFTDNYRVTVLIENYDGFVSVEVTGVGGAAQQSVQITGSGQVALDISPFNAGSYTLRVILSNTVYEGSFEKL